MKPLDKNRFEPPVSFQTSENRIDAGVMKKECIRNLQDFEFSSEDCLYLDIWQPKKIVESSPKWTVVYFCDGYISLNGLTSNEIARTKCRNWMGYFTEDFAMV